MILSRQKPVEEILELLKNEKNIFVIGCDGCADVCNTGGVDACKKIKKELFYWSQAQSSSNGVEKRLLLNGLHALTKCRGVYMYHQIFPLVFHVSKEVLNCRYIRQQIPDNLKRSYSRQKTSVMSNEVSIHWEIRQRGL